MSQKELSASDAGDRKELKRRDVDEEDQHNSDEEIESTVTRFKNWLLKQKSPEPSKPIDIPSKSESVDQTDEESYAPDEEEEDSSQPAEEELEDEDEDEDAVVPEDEDDEDDNVNWAEAFQRANAKILRQEFVALVKRMAGNAELDMIGKKIKVAEALRNSNLFEAFCDLISEAAL
jgi:hypothetical protein